MNRINGGWTRALLAATLALGLSSAARADETLRCNANITSVPYTITTQGHYCFNRSLSTAQTSGAAITINADFVTLDLNGYRLAGGGSPGTLATGVLATARKNLVIRNGNIRGFWKGVVIGGKASVVEHLRVDENSANGIAVGGSYHVVRHNEVSDTGGNTTGTQVTGIYFSGDSLQIVDNSVVNTFDNSSANGDPIAIWGGDPTLGTSILIINNRVVDKTSGGIFGNGSVCRDNVAVVHGIWCAVLVGTTNYP